MWRKEKPDPVAAEPPVPAPDLMVTYRYESTPSSYAWVTIPYTGVSVAELTQRIEDDRNEDRMITLGVADGSGHEVTSFPACSIIDVKIKLAPAKEEQA